jgi:hypothetical protein
VAKLKEWQKTHPELFVKKVYRLNQNPTTNRKSATIMG